MNRFLTLVAIFLFAMPLMAQDKPELKSSDLKKLSKPFGAWVNAKIEGDPAAASKAMMDLDSVRVKVEKKLKGRAVLSLVRDWEWVFQNGRKFETSGKLIKKGKVLERDMGAYGKYYVWLPSSYNPNKVSYPTILLLDADPSTTLKALPPEVKDTFIVLAPEISSLDASALLEVEGRSLIVGPIGQGTVSYRVDRRHLFLFGKGEMGVQAAATYAAVLPHFFTGVALIGAEAKPVPGQGNLKLMPVEQKESLADAAVWASGLSSHTLYPTSFEVELVEPWQGRAFWVQALKFDTGDALPEGKAARLKVAVDRGTNTITIDGEYVYQVMLLLNDALVDLDKPIHVLRNGQTYTFQSSRSLGTLLENYVLSLDGSVFPAKLRELDLPMESSKSEEG